MSGASRNEDTLLPIKGSSSVRKSLNESRLSKSTDSPNKKYSSNGRLSTQMCHIEENTSEIDQELEDLKKIK